MLSLFVPYTQTKKNIQLSGWLSVTAQKMCTEWMMHTDKHASLQGVCTLEINPEYSLEGLMLKLRLQNYDHLMQRTDSLGKTLMLGKTEDKRRRGQQRMMRWLDSVNNSMDMNLSKLQEMVKDRGAWRDTVHGVTESRR